MPRIWAVALTMTSKQKEHSAIKDAILRIEFIRFSVLLFLERELAYDTRNVPSELEECLKEIQERTAER